MKRWVLIAVLVIGVSWLLVDRLENRRLPRSQLPRLGQGIFDRSQGNLVEPPCRFFAIPRDEGDRIARLKQLDQAWTHDQVWSSRRDTEFGFQEW